MALDDSHGPPTVPGPLAHDTAPDDELLPCGASLATLWEDGEPRPGHDDCPPCGAALGELTALDDVVHAALTVPGSAAENLAGRVMDLVRTEVRPGRTLPLGEVADDDWITETAAARVLREAAESVRGVAAGSCRIHPLSATPGSARSFALPGTRLPREPLRVALEVAAPLSWTIPAVAAAVRERVLTAARERVGLDVAQIDVTVIDLLDDQPATDAGGAGRNPA
ncbi:hypothetical protein ABZ721_10455 [Streptomyces sp. NPDC006733]|uniref:hypothetical protein n=1 Tax=Streptomyces sp. NPDC006733 TaxID=3155460 RepID=UPI0033D1A616